LIISVSKSKKTGVTLFHFIRICGPVYYCHSTFSDQILDINKLRLANTVKASFLARERDLSFRSVPFRTVTLIVTVIVMLS
jgi:hypothetical protein